MEVPESYPFRCEEEILRNQSDSILAQLGDIENLSIVELGAGDGRKTRLLLQFALQRFSKVRYRPVDISRLALKAVVHTLSDLTPALSIESYELDLETGWADLRFREQKQTWSTIWVQALAILNRPSSVGFSEGCALD